MFLSAPLTQSGHGPEVEVQRMYFGAFAGTDLESWPEGRDSEAILLVAHLYRMKVADRIHWGPHGLIVLETAFAETAGLHDYLGTPEIVEDIAICCRQQLGIDLASRFWESSVPCIVKFRTQDARRSLLEVGARKLRSLHEMFNDTTAERVASVS